MRQTSQESEDEEIDRRHKAGEEVSADDRLFEAEYVAKRAAANERKRVRDQADKDRFDDIRRQDVAGEEVSADDRLFEAEYVAKRAATNEYKIEWRKANQDRYEEIDRRHKAGKVLSKEDRLFRADYEAKLQQKRDADNERRRVRKQEADKDKYEEIDSRHKAGKVLSEDDRPTRKSDRTHRPPLFFVQVCFGLPCAVLESAMYLSSPPRKNCLQCHLPTLQV